MAKFVHRWATMPGLVTLLVVSPLSGCGDDGGAEDRASDEPASGSASGESASGEAEPSGACRASLEPLQSYMAGMTAHASNFIDVDDTPVTTFGEPLRPAPIVLFQEGVVQMDGTRMGPVGDEATWTRLAQELATLRSNWGVLHPNVEYEPIVVVGAPAATSMSDIRRLVNVDGIETLDVVVQNGNVEEGLAVETPDWVREAVESGERAAIRAAYTRATGACEAAEPFSVLVQRVDPAQPAARLGELDTTLPDALASCECEGVDVTGLIALIHQNGRMGRPQRRVTVQFRDDGFDLPLPEGADLGAFIAALEPIDEANRGAVHLVGE